MASGPAPTIDKRWLAVLGGLCLALAATSATLAWRLGRLSSSQGVFFGEDALRDPEVRRRVVAQLIENQTQPFDSHPDPDVGRTLIAEAERGEYRTNAMGVREMPVETPKPADVVRIVLLGDSFVFGLNVAADERLGAELQRLLDQGGAASGKRFECLHLAINSWNIHAECTFLRRQLDQLRPDLVIQVTVANDLDDVTGVRGFGAESSFSPRHGQRADSLVLDRYAQSFLRQDTRNLLGRGLDHESRSRFADALASVRALRADLAELPGKPAHLMVFHWGPLGPAAYENMGRDLESDVPGSVLWIPLEFAADKSKWITPSDYHWNAGGHAEVGRVLYGLIRGRALLPGIELAPQPQFEATAQAWSTHGLELVRTGSERMHATVKEYTAGIDYPEITLVEARQIYGGLDLDGLVSPYASFVLQRPPGSKRLSIRAAGLPDRSLRALRPRVFLENIELGTLPLQPEAVDDHSFAIPAELEGREFLNVRFESDDWVYRGRELRHCVAFRLERAALE